ncbi:hypothetical protein VCR14J2_410339 [Vibrio coralliirubri]|nr:hypothetical protein VCR14J2_410339 [Vibrio coralliirubri]
MKSLEFSVKGDVRDILRRQIGIA